MGFRAKVQGSMASFSLLIVLCAAAVSGATTFRYLSLGDLATAAETVVRARCLSGESRWEGGEIWTFTQFEAVESLKGNVPRLLTVRTLGGRVGHLQSIVEGAPAFHAGEEVFLFLGARRADSFSVLGWAQGTFRIRSEPGSGRESVTQDSAGLAVMDGATGRLQRKGIRNLPVEEFRQRIASAIERSSGRRR